MNDSTRTRPLLLLLLPMLLLAPASSAEESGREVAAQLERLNDSLSESNRLLRRLVEHQESMLLLGRLELAAARETELSARLAEARRRLSELQVMEVEVRNQLAEAREGLDLFEGALRRQAERNLAAVEARQRAHEERVRAAELEVIRLEADEQQASDQLTALRDRLDLLERARPAVGR